MEKGWDPAIKKYFRKILATIGWGLLWIMTILITGLYFGWAWHANKFFAALFYAFVLVSLGFLLRQFLRIWRNSNNQS